MLVSRLHFPWARLNLPCLQLCARRSLHSSGCYNSKEGADGGDQHNRPPRRPLVPPNINYQKELYEETYCPPLADPLPSKAHEHPFIKATNALGITGRNDPKRNTNDLFPRHADIVIIGGGVMGCSTAYHLKQIAHDNGLNIVVIERDFSYTRASTVLSVGGLRQQFSLPENIQMSLYGAEFLRKSKKLLSGEGLEAPDVQFHPHGYLFLASQMGAEQLEANHRLQTGLGAKIQLLTPRMLKEKFPWIETDGVALASYGLENEGWFDPWALLNGFRNKAIQLGVTFARAEAVGFEAEEILGQFRQDGDGLLTHRRLKRVQVRLADGEMKTIDFAICVIAAGPQSGEVGKMAGVGLGTGLLRVPLPVEPRKRYVYCFHAPDGPGLDCPLTVDTNGSYFRREGLGGHYIAGKSPIESEEPGIANLDVDYTFFDQQVWPDIARRVPSFENIKLKSAWAGYYDYNTLDQNAIIGNHPYHSNLFFATGFSGHGIQQAPAAGRAIMELIMEGQFLSINLDRFGFRRIVTNQPIYEQNIV